jgi:hypothetical protein
MIYNVQLFDVDGTLTKSEKDTPPGASVYQTFAFWPLISYQLAKSPAELRMAIEDWERSMLAELDPDESSRKMMERVVKNFLRSHLAQQNMVDCAKEITRNFLLYDIVHLDAIEYIRECLAKNIICILTTGSYLDGLRGFVEVLQERKLLPKSPYLLLNGAEIDWSKPALTWANIGKYKTEKVYETLELLSIKNHKIQAAFGDDPYVNDKGILEMADASFVIKCKKNAEKPFSLNFEHCTWQEFFLEHKNRLLGNVVSIR